MCNQDFRPELGYLYELELRSPASSHRPSTPEVPLDSDAYWHSGTTHDGRGEKWELWEELGKVHAQVGESASH